MPPRNTNQPTLGLRRKHCYNTIEAYAQKKIKNDFFPVNLHQVSTEAVMEMLVNFLSSSASGLPEVTCQAFMKFLKENPQNHFNFGFTYNDFKAYLLKLVYMRAQRTIIEEETIKNKFATLVNQLKKEKNSPPKPQPPASSASPVRVPSDSSPTERRSPCLKQKKKMPSPTKLVGMNQTQELLQVKQFDIPQGKLAEQSREQKSGPRREARHSHVHFGPDVYQMYQQESKEQIPTNKHPTKDHKH